MSPPTTIREYYDLLGQELDVSWPGWRNFRSVHLRGSPIMVMGWLSDDRTILMDSLTAAESRLLGGGFGFKYPDSCNCVVRTPDPRPDCAADEWPDVWIWSQIRHGGLRDSDRILARKELLRRSPNEPTLGRVALNDAFAWRHNYHDRYNRALAKIVSETIGADALIDMIERDMTSGEDQCMPLDWSERTLLLLRG